MYLLFVIYFKFNDKILNIIFQASDIIRIHESKCGNAHRYRGTQMSADGVSECNSNSNTLTVFSVRFKNCGTVYPHTIIRPCGKHKVEFQKHFKQFLNDLLENRCYINMFIGDNPMRALVRYALNHAALYSCEYCFQKGTTLKNCDPKTIALKKDLLLQKRFIDEEINELRENEEENEDKIARLISISENILASLRDIARSKGHVVWPSSSMNGESRSKEKILDILSEIQRNPNPTKDEAKGICGHSPLLDIPYFHFVIDIPTEYLHSVCLGVSKKMVELTFDVGQTRQRATKRKLSSAATFNMHMRLIKVCKEFPRRARTLDFSVMKGIEFRNLALFFFPLILECIEPNAQERKLWLLFSFIVRACTIPDREFQVIRLAQIKSCAEKFYRLYELLFTSANCTYNTHIVGSHILDMRVHGPLTLSSAFGFENFYGELRNSFVPGTTSPPKQIMKTIYVKRQIAFHSCKPVVTFTNYETPLESNNLVYTYLHKVYRFYRIDDILTDDDFSCFEIEKEEADFTETPDLKWDQVGVFTEIGENDYKCVIKKKDVSGKLIRVQKYLLTCPMNVLEEK